MLVIQLYHYLFAENDITKDSFACIGKSGFDMEVVRNMESLFQIYEYNRFHFIY